MTNVLRESLLAIFFLLIIVYKGYALTEPANHVANLGYSPGSSSGALRVIWKENNTLYSNVFHMVVVVRAGSNFPLVADGVPPLADDGSFNDGIAIKLVPANLWGFSSSVLFDGLPSNTWFRVRVYSYSNISGEYNYKLDGTIPEIPSILVTTPTAQASKLTFGSTGDVSIKIAWQSGNGFKRLLVGKAGSPILDTEFPLDDKFYTANSSMGSGSPLGTNGAFVLYNGSGNEVEITNLAQGTEYFFRLFEFNDDGVRSRFLRISATGNPTSRWSLARAPLYQPTDLVVLPESPTKLRLSFTPSVSNPDGYMVLRRPETVAATAPTDGTKYGVGEQINGQHIVAIGTATVLTDSLLNPETIYNYDIYAYNWVSGVDYSYNYRTAIPPLSGGRITPALEPTLQANELTLTAKDEQSAQWSWKRGDGISVLAVVTKGISIAYPLDFQGYKSDSIYANGDRLGGESFVAYMGAGNAFRLTGLSPETQYRIDLFEFNGTNASANYLFTQTTGNSRTFTTLATEPLANPDTVLFSLASATSVSVSFPSVVQAAKGYLVLRRTGNASPPADGVDYSLNAWVGEQTVVFKGAGTTFVDTDLLTNTLYDYDIYAYNGSGSSINYRQLKPASAGYTTPAAEPTIQASNIVLLNRQSDRATIQWQNGDGEKRVVLGTVLGSLDPLPDFKGVKADSVFGQGTIVGAGSYVLGELTGNQLTFSGLEPEKNYQIGVFEVNGAGKFSNYLLNNAFNNPITFTTLATEPVANPNALRVVPISPSEARISFSPVLNFMGNYLVVRRNLGAARNAPVDGQSYTQGEMLGSGLIVYAGPDTVLNRSNHLPSMAYEYDVYAFTGSNGTQNYRQQFPISACYFSPAQEPSIQASEVNFPDILSDQVLVKWSKGSGSKRLIVAAKHPAEMPLPIDFRAYSASQVFGQGESLAADVYAIAWFSGDTIRLTGLAAATPYKVAVFEANGDSVMTNYLTSLNAGNPSGFHTLAWMPSGFDASAEILFSQVTDTSLVGSFTAIEAEKYLIVRRIEGALPTFPKNGTSYAAGESFAGQQVVAVVSKPAFQDQGLSAATRYQYDVYAFNGDGPTAHYQLARSLRRSVTTLAAAPVLPPHSLEFRKVTSSSAHFQFGKGLPNAQRYLVLVGLQITTNQSFPVEDGRGYAVGDTVGDFRVLSIAQDTAFQLTNLRQEQAYALVVIGYNGDGETANYLRENPLIGTFFTANTAPSQLALSDSSVVENAGEWALVGRFSAFDPDPTDSLRFGLIGGEGDRDNTLFSVLGDSLLAKPLLQINPKGQYSIRVGVADGAGGALESRFSIQFHYLPLALSDSLALLAMRDSLAQAVSWPDTLPMREWEGIGIRLGRVRSVQLAAKGLSRLPLAELQSLDSLQWLNVANNQLTINQLIPFSTHLARFDYWPQQLTSVPDTLFAYSGDTLRLQVPNHSAAGRFQWWLNGVSMEGDTLDMLHKPSLKRTDSGKYACQVTHPQLPLVAYWVSQTWLKVVDRTSVADSLALVAVLKDLFGDEFPQLFPIEEPVSEWPGIVVEDNRVVELNLSNRGLTGPFPLAITQLTELRKLDLFNNQLSGEIPAEIGHLIHLVYLDLDRNLFSGEVPAQIGRLRQLKTLWLARNELTALPDSVMHLTQLEHLFIQQNQLESLPPQMANLQRLKTLDASENLLTVFGVNVSGMDSLESLDLSRNQLVQLSGSVLTRPLLAHLDISNNLLRQLPADGSLLEAIQQFNLYNNLFDFEDLEALQLPTATTMEYAPQKRPRLELDTLVAQGKSVVLTPMIGGKSNRFQWQKDGAVVQEGTAAALGIASVNQAATGTYTCRVTNTNWPQLTLFSHYYTILMDCGNQFGVTLSTAFDTTVCSNESVYVELLTVHTDGNTYKWRKDGVTQPLADRFNYVATEPGSYQVVVTNASGCTMFSNVISVKTVAVPEVALSMPDSMTLVANTGTTGARYAWYLNGEELPNSDKSTWAVEAGGQYQVKVTNPQGCAAVSASRQVVLTANEPQAISPELISVWPNPIGDHFYVESRSGRVQGIRVYHLSGALMSEIPVASAGQVVEMDASGWPSGLYFVEILTQKGRAVQKIWKQ